MRVHLILIIHLLVGIAQAQESKVIPSVTTLVIEEGTVTPLHLSPGYTTSVRLPEEISSVVIGNPATFKAEHSEAEPRLVFLKPITAQPSESNALIMTKSGQEITLHLVSGGKAVANARVDFLVEHRRQQSFLVGPPDRQSFLIAETHPILPAASSSPPSHPEKPDLIARELEKQKSVSTPTWEGKEVLAAVGASVKRDHQTVLGFSILNSSNRTIELLPPQVELTGIGHGNGGKRIQTADGTKGWVGLNTSQLSKREYSQHQRQLRARLRPLLLDQLDATKPCGTTFITEHLRRPKIGSRFCSPALPSPEP
jgi:hypothetical protein